MPASVGIQTFLLLRFIAEIPLIFFNG